LNGIILEAKEQLKLITGMQEMNYKLIEAQENISKSWTDLFRTADVPYIDREGFKHVLDKDMQMNDKILADPNHPVTAMLLYCYSIETFIYPVINAASRSSDL
jgi:hypothetical protein